MWKQCRCALEMEAPAGITVAEFKQIKTVQKAVFAIILGNKYVSYEYALADFKMETLKERRNTQSSQLGFNKVIIQHKINSYL